MHGFHAAQLLANQGNIGHGRELEQHQRTGGKELRKQLQYIRLAVFQAEDLAPVGCPARRIQKEDVRMEVPQQMPDRSRACRHTRLDRVSLSDEFRAGNRHVREPQGREIVPGGIGQLRTHLIVQHPVKHLRECPAIHSQSPGEVCQAALRGSSSHHSLVTGGFRGGALLPGDPKREPQGGNSIPLRHFFPQFPPHFQGG